MTIFLIALAVGVVAAFVLWKLGQRDPGPAQSSIPRPRVAAVAQLLFYPFIFYPPASGAFEAWVTLGDMAAQMNTPSDPVAYAERLRSARYDLVIGAVASTIGAAVMAFVVIPDLFKAFMRPATDASAKPQETHA